MRAWPFCMFWVVAAERFHVLAAIFVYICLCSVKLLSSFLKLQLYGRQKPWVMTHSRVYSLLYSLNVEWYLYIYIYNLYYFLP